MPDFVGSYHEAFSVLRADRPERLDQAYRLRYRVYCIENQFEDHRHFPDGRETDADDDRSAHTLLVHRRSGAAVGTARLILPDRSRPLPIERVLRPAELPALRRLPWRRTAEVSRFAVSKQFRRRRGEERYADARLGRAGLAAPRTDLSAAERRLLPQITFGLLRGILGICIECDIAVVVAVMEPALLRILRRLGLDFEPLGPLVEHHGWRQPSVAHFESLLRQSRACAGPLWRYVATDLSTITPNQKLAAD